VPELSSVVASGVNTVIWAGDADAVCTWFGGLAVADTLSWSGSHSFKHAKESNYTVDGRVGGTLKSVDNLTWLRVFEAGHQVPYFRESLNFFFALIHKHRITDLEIEPELALQVFKQTMQKKPLWST
jgi:carboxypeptidase C (cathepsin A)